MRRFAIATLAGLTLLAGQAVAANQGAELRVGDRVGPIKGVSKNFAGDRGVLFGLTSFELTVAAVAVGIGVVAVFATTNDASP